MSTPAGHYLVLCPATPASAPDNPQILIEALQNIGFLGNAQMPGRFSTGPAYLEWMTYLGCSPQISLGEADTATFIRIKGPDEHVQFYSSPHARPRCRACRQAFDLQVLSSLVDETVTCPHCKTLSYAAKLDWRRKAGFARFVIEISNVYESEAVPSDGLLEKLEHLTGQAWDYFYRREN